MHPDDVTITVAILTFRRPEGLRRALTSLSAVSTPPERVQILVIDNDPLQSARDLVSQLPNVRYEWEPTPGVAAARNAAIAAAGSDVLVFLDDDERATDGWPHRLVDLMLDTGADLVGGPVLTNFLSEPPQWIVDEGVFERPNPPNGSRQSWLRTGNLAMNLQSIRSSGIRFDSAFGISGGEDVKFTTDASDAGLVLRWCDSAVVIEDVDSSRFDPGWIVGRQRTATANYVRATSPRGIRGALVAAPKIAARSVQALAFGLAGMVTRRPQLRMRGRLRWARAAGTLDGLLDRSSVTYSNNPESIHR